jgi:hypothetical protein
LIKTTVPRHRLTSIAKIRDLVHLGIERMKKYKGASSGGQYIVTVDGLPLPAWYPASHRRNVPFEWGKRSPGTDHLALAILSDCAGAETARMHAHDFVIQYACRFQSDWETTSEEIEKWLKIKRGIGYPVQKSSWNRSALKEAAPAAVPLRPDDFPSFPVDHLKRRATDSLESLRERIKPDELAKHGFPRPKDVQLSRGTDSSGEEAIDVYQVFPNKTPDESLAWKKIEPMVSWVRNLIWTETGAQFWPYVKVRRQKELAGGMA